MLQNHCVVLQPEEDFFLLLEHMTYQQFKLKIYQVKPMIC